MNAQPNLQKINPSINKKTTSKHESKSTISGVMSLAIVRGFAITHWRRNLSLHCISGGTSRCACIVTEQKRKIHNLFPQNDQIKTKKERKKEKQSIRSSSNRIHFIQTINIACRTRQDNSSVGTDAIFLRIRRLHLPKCTNRHESHLQTIKITDLQGKEKEIGRRRRSEDYLKSDIIVRLIRQLKRTRDLFLQLDFSIRNQESKKIQTPNPKKHTRQKERSFEKKRKLTGESEFLRLDADQVSGAHGEWIWGLEREDEKRQSFRVFLRGEANFSTLVFGVGGEKTGAVVLVPRLPSFTTLASFSLLS